MAACAAHALVGACFAQMFIGQALDAMLVLYLAESFRGDVSQLPQNIVGQDVLDSERTALLAALARIRSSSSSHLLIV